MDDSSSDEGKREKDKQLLDQSDDEEEKPGAEASKDNNLIEDLLGLGDSKPENPPESGTGLDQINFGGE